MGSAKKKKSRCFFPFSLASTKRSKNNKASSSSTYKTRRRSQVLNHYELKDMRELSSNDEAFRLSTTRIKEIIDILCSRKTPTPKTYRKWDEYAISFYLKMCTCFGVDYQHLEDDVKKSPLPSMSFKGQEKHMECTDMTQLSTKEECVEQGENMECGGAAQPSTEDKSYEERLEELENVVIGCCRLFITGPFEIGSYSFGTAPDRIPYHLYLLVKDAVDIMDRIDWHNKKDRKDLQCVETKIWFFCTYFHIHLPTGWNYTRDNCSSLIAGYDTTRKPRDLMAGYTPPIGDRVEPMWHDQSTLFSAQEIVDIMSIIHTRKTPTFWKLGWQVISFYCKLCSCFGLDYHSLETASEDDVCLMNMGRSSHFVPSWYRC